MKLQSFIGALLMVGLFLLKEKRVSWSIKIPWGYFLIAAVSVGYSPWFMPGYAPEFQNVIAWNATKYLFQLILFPLIILGLTPRYLKLAFICAWIFVVSDTIFLLYVQGRGLIEATTFDASVLACLSPLWFRRKWWAYIALVCTAIAIAYTKTRTGAVTVLFMTLIYFWPYTKILQKKWLYFAEALLACSMVGGAIWYFPKFIHDPRTMIWARSMDWWLEKVSPIFGAGIGSFEWTGLLIDVRQGSLKYYLLHNDYLQTIFDTGLIGLGCLLFIYFYTLRKIKDRASLAAWCGLGITACLYYPIHAFVLQFYALVIMTGAVAKNKNI